nr:ABC transporter permease [Paenibacillus bovis]
MTFRRFAFNNVMRNKRTYAAYFLSSTFSVLVFFVYAMFAFHPSLLEINPNVAIGLHFAEAIIYVFSFIFVLISMSAFLKSRKKEFGLMVMHGMTNMQLRKMVFLENVIIGFFATISGITLGLVFGKVILLTAEKVLDLEQSLNFYIPIQALLLTFIAFLLLFIIISFSTVSILKGNKLVDLIKGNEAPKKEPKASVYLSVLSIILLAAGYTTALIVKNLQVIIAMIPVTIVVIIGTYFLFTQLSVYTINLLKKSKNFFWKKTNLVLMSDLAYRMKDNARTFFFVAIVSTVAFSAIGSLVGFRAMMTKELVKESPFAIEYESYSNNKDEEAHLELIRNELKTNDIPFVETKTAIMEIPKGDITIYVVRESDYNALAKMKNKEQVKLADNETALLYYHSSIGELETRDEQKEFAIGEKSLQQVRAIPTNLLPGFHDFYIVNDNLYQELKKDDTKESLYYAFSIDDWKETIPVGKKLTEDLHRFGDSYEFTSLGNEWNELNQGFGAVLFVGLFIGVIFFVAAGSFLYFRLYTDLDMEKAKFKAINKMGITSKELSKVITIQLALLFFVPIVIALIHGSVALTALQRMFNYNLMMESTLVLGAFSIIQIVYFLLIRQNYIRKIKYNI